MLRKLKWQISEEPLAVRYNQPPGTGRLRNTTLHEDQYTLLMIPRSFLLRMRNVSNKSCRENQNTHFVLRNFFFENHTVYEIMWKNIVERGRPQMTIWRMRVACWIPKATNTHTLRLSNTHCFSTATMVKRTRHKVTLYVQCLYCLFSKSVQVQVTTNNWKSYFNLIRRLTPIKQALFYHTEFPFRYDIPNAVTQSIIRLRNPRDRHNRISPSISNTTLSIFWM